MKVINLGSVSAVGVVGNSVEMAQFVDGYTAQMMNVQFIMTGDPLTGVIDMEGSLDGTNWFVIDSHTVAAGEITALGGMYFVIDKPVKHLRANVSTLTFTTAGTVQVSIFAGK